MKATPFFTRLAAVTLAGLLVGTALFAQYREYYFYGKVVDTAKQPLAGVEIKLRDEERSLSYDISTNKSGEFKFAGLPHGKYKVTFTKAGFAVKEDEWKFVEPQDKMQRVEVPTVTLVSQELVEKTQQLKAMEAEIKAAAEKIRTKDFDGAIAELQAFLGSHPKDANALYYLGICYSRKNMNAEAVAALTQVAEQAPKFPPVYFELGVCYQHQGDKDKALEAYQKNFELDPSNVDSAYNTGLILFGLGRPDEARTVLLKAMALRPGDVDVLDVLGRCAINLGNYAEALDYLEKAKAGMTDPERIKTLDALIEKLKEQIKK